MALTSYGGPRVALTLTLTLTLTQGPLHEQSAADFRALLELNAVSVLIVSSAVMRHAMVFTLDLALTLTLTLTLALTLTLTLTLT